VVEDNEDNRRILVYRLKKIGQFDIREATNGQEAIDAVKADPPDLVFMDLKMPVMDGWEATKRIREMEGGSAVRIIALTAQAMAGDEEKALAAIEYWIPALDEASWQSKARGDGGYELSISGRGGSRPPRPDQVPPGTLAFDADGGVYLS